MCLAEALLRIPDAETADELIADKLSGPDWAEKLGDSPLDLRQRRDLLAAADRQGARQTPTTRRDGWRAALGRAVGRLGEPVIRTAVSQAMKILGRQFVFGRTIDEALKRAAPERRQGLTHSFDMLGEAAQHPCRRRALRQGLCRRARPHRQGGEGRLPLVAGHFGQAVGAAPALRMEPRRGGQGGDAAGAARAGAEGAQGRRPFHHRRRGSRPARAVARHHRGAGRRRRAVRQRLGRLRPRHPGLSEARRAACATGSPSSPASTSAASWSGWSRAPIGTPRSRPRRSPGCDDYPVFTRKVATDVSYLACAKRLLAASDVHLPGLRHPQRQHHRRDQGAGRRRRRSSSSACTAWARGFTRSWPSSSRHRRRARRRCASTRRSAATRTCSPISSAACSRTAPTRSFVNRIADEEVPLDELVRDPVAELAGARAQAQSGDPACPTTSSARAAATAPAST